MKTISTLTTSDSLDAITVGEADRFGAIKLWDPVRQTFVLIAATDNEVCIDTWLRIMNGVGIEGGIDPNTTGYKALRFSTGVVQPEDSTLISATFNTPFPDDVYSINATVIDGTAGDRGLTFERVVSKTQYGVSVRVRNNADVPITGEVHIRAIREV